VLAIDLGERVGIAGAKPRDELLVVIALPGDHRRLE